MTPLKFIRSGPLTATSATMDFSSATVPTPLRANISSAERTDASVNAPPSRPAGMAARPTPANYTGASGCAEAASATEGPSVDATTATAPAAKSGCSSGVPTCAPGRRSWSIIAWSLAKSQGALLCGVAY